VHKSYSPNDIFKLINSQYFILLICLYPSPAPSPLLRCTNLLSGSKSDARLPVLIEISTRMSYIFPSGKDFGLGSSRLSLQTPRLRSDVKSSRIDNGAKGLPVTSCVIGIRVRNGSERAKFQSPMMLVIVAVYTTYSDGGALSIETCLAHCSSYVSQLNVRIG
jgi:hypothetical protein